MLIRKVLIGLLLALFGGGLIVWFTTSHSYVTTPSMWPNIKPGAEIFYSAAEEYEVGDVIVFPANGLTWAHRLIEINDDGSYVTKGDNPRNSPDVFVPPITADDVIGKVDVSVPFLGFPKLIVKDPGYGLSWLRAELGAAGRIGFVAIVALIAIYYIFDVRGWWQRRRGRDTPPPDERAGGAADDLEHAPPDGRPAAEPTNEGDVTGGSTATELGLPEPGSGGRHASE